LHSLLTKEIRLKKANSLTFWRGSSVPIFK